MGQSLQINSDYNIKVANGAQIVLDTGITNQGIRGKVKILGELDIGGDLTTTAATFNLANTTATTVNFAGAGTAVNIGAATGTTHIKNNLDVDGDVNIDGGDLTVSTTTFNLANSTATIINAFGAATSVVIGSATGTTNVRNNLDVDGDVNIDGNLTVAIFNLNTTATTGNVFGAATAVNIAVSAATASTLTFGPAITNNVFEINSTASGTINLTTDVTTGVVNVYTGITTGTLNLVTGGASTTNIGGAVATVNIGTSAGNSILEIRGNATTGTATLRTNSGVTTANVFNTSATAVNAFGTGTTISIGASTGTTTINNANTVVTGDLAVNGGDVTSTATTFNLLNNTVTAGNLFGAGTTISIGASTGTTTVNNSLVVSGNLTINGTTTTINATTITVDDKNIELGSVAVPDNTTADGGGITLKGATDKTFKWVNATNAWTSSEDLNLLTGKVYEINGTSVLSSTALGTGVTASSLTSVGTIGSGIWQGTIINSTYGGTGVNNGGRTFTIGGNFAHVGAHSLTLNTTANTSVTLPTAGTLATTGNLSQFASTTSAQLAGIISDETGSGELVFASSPTFTTGILTNSSTFNVFDTVATILNIGAAATAFNAGATSGTMTLRNPTIVGSQTTQSLFNTVATTVNFAQAATTLSMGATTGTTTINNANTVVTGDLAVNGGDITTTATGTATVFNTNATTVNAFGAAGTISLGAATGTTTINNANTVVTGDLAVNGGDITTTATGTATVFNTNATTVNAFGAAGTISLGAATGTTTINNANTVVTGDLAVNGADITTTATGTATVFNTNATTGNLFGAGTAVNIGAATGTTTINNANTVVTGDLAVNGGDITTTATGTATVFNTNATTVNAFGAGTAVNIGAATGTTSIRNNLNVTGTVTAALFSGSGSSLTALNASNLSSGTVPNAAISGIYTGMTNLTGTGNVDFSRFLGNAADTALAPSFSWSIDPNTGIFQPAADQVGISTGGTVKLTVSTTEITSALAISAPDFNSTSDIRFKENVVSVSDALGKVNKLRGVNFNWKDSGKYSMGLIAQEVEEVLPEVVSTATDGHKSVSYQSMIGVLIEAIKDQQKQIDELKKLIDKE